ncbi:ATP-binding protein [Streptomyces lushanensis]|uniref:ATP-binding protein n=1 Tax=Streptomyces lushanensis TaxID=1434255 RepID=UPI0008369BBB|nr:ATP-binding protein [Streptomyces lushanensis]
MTLGAHAQARPHAGHDAIRTEPQPVGRPPGTETAARDWEFAVERMPRPFGRSMAEGDERWPGQVRRAGCAWLEAWGLAELGPDIGLLLSELVTSAFRYGRGDQIGVRLRLTGLGMLRIEVDDGEPVAPPARVAEPEDGSGHGPLLVDAVVAERGGDWGVSGDGTKTWCSIPVRMTESAGAVAVAAAHR